jgi:hypothetical protein
VLQDGDLPAHVVDVGTSLRLGTDLHAYLSPVARSVHRYVVPNCSLPSFRSRWNSVRTSTMGRCRTVPISPVGVRRPIDPGSRGGAPKDSGTSRKYCGIDGRCGGSAVIGISCSYVLVKQLRLPIDSLLPERLFFPSRAPFASKGWTTRI